MGSIKRKDAARAENGGDPKRAKLAANNDTHKPAKEPAAPPPTSTLLRDEEPAFPRGGASVLTPLEQKQIQIKATKDALFETQGSDEEDAPQKAVKKAKKAKKSKNKIDAIKPEIRIEGLNFKVCDFQ